MICVCDLVGVFGVVDGSGVDKRTYAAHPERFVHGPPQAPRLPGAVWINPPKAVVEPNETEEKK